MNKPSYLTDNDWNLLKKKYRNLRPVIRKLRKNYPVQYLIGNVDFYGYEIDVKKGVLIPRFETETLLEKTIELLKKYDMTDTSVLDIGTGSGCIPIVLKKELKDLTVTTIDKSGKALKIAKQKGKAIVKKSEELYKLAIEKGTPVLENAADEIRKTSIDVLKSITKKLEQKDKK